MFDFFLERVGNDDHSELLDVLLTRKVKTKEIKWGQIPESEKEFYRKAMDAEWVQWLRFKACEIIPPEDLRTPPAMFRTSGR